MRKKGKYRTLFFGDVGEFLYLCIVREEGNETVTNCHQLKLKAADGKKEKWHGTGTWHKRNLMAADPLLPPEKD